MKGTIYLLSNSVDEMVYVGSTVQTLTRRMASHRHCAKNRHESDVYQYMHKVGISKWGIKAIKICTVKTRAELGKIEYECMKNYPRNLLLNMDTEHGKRSEECRKKSAIAQRGVGFKRGCIGKIQSTTRGKIFKYIRFSWQFWEGDKRVCKRKQFSIDKHGERGAMKLAEKFRNEIYPINE